MSAHPWIEQLTGRKDTAVRTVNIQNKEPIAPYSEYYKCDGGSTHWTNKAVYVSQIERQNASWSSNIRRKAGESVENYQKRREAEVNKTREVSNPKLLHYDEGGVQATHVGGGCNFFMTFYNAYNCHGEIVLSPDDVWTMIQLSFSKYMNSKPETAERLRPMLVDFPGRKEIIVQIPAPVGGETNLEEKWNLFCEKTQEEMTRLMRPGVMDDMVAKFSTTSRFESFMSQAIIMDCFQAFFEYTMRMSCGITKVHFMGTQSDWDVLPQKLEGLRKYEGQGGDGSWTRYVDRLKPVLENLALASAGKVDVSWWNSVIDERHAEGYGGTPAELSGWALRFIYGLPDKVEDTGDIQALFARVPVTIDDHDMREIKTKIFAGFSGLVVGQSQEAGHQVFRPHKSVAVLVECPEEDDKVKEKREGWYIPGNPKNYETSVSSRETDKPRPVHHTELEEQSFLTRLKDSAKSIIDRVSKGSK